MRFLVIGASGAQGGAVARHLTERGHDVRGFSRTGDVPAGVRPFRGDLGDAARVKEAFDGVTHASVTLPLVYDPATVSAHVRHVIDGALAAGVRRLAFNTGNRLPEAESGVAAFETRRRAPEGATLDLGGPDTVTGPELAAMFGPGVRYEEQDVAAFESGLAHAVGAEAAAGVAATYRWIGGRRGFFTPSPGLAERLGLRLTPLRDWIAT